MFPSPSITPLQLTDACGEDPGWFCERAYDLTENEALAKAVDWAFGAPLRGLLILIAAVIVHRLARRGIDRTVGHAVRPQELALAGFEILRLEKLKLKAPAAPAPGVRDVRTEARARTISAVAKSSASILIWSLATLLVLGEFGVNLAPLIAGAGIAGIALGFGAQSLVKDCITGLFMLAEDQYGVGDIVDVGEASGVVESISLRVTRLRSVDGTVWHVPNGVISRVGNMSQVWSVALLDVDVSYGTDVDRATSILIDAATEVCQREEFIDVVIEPPEVLGIEQLGADAVVLRLTVKTRAGKQWALKRALRAGIKRAFDQAEVEIPFPQRTIWVRHEDRDELEGPEPSG